MIPRRLLLRNFLSYREATIDFSGLHVAVLSGKNGDGKSALLDAMTWALWGKCRGDTQDERIYLGQNEMLVEFEFKANNDVFRVIRKRTRGRTTGSLEFFQQSEDGGWLPRTGGVMTQTQEEIIRRTRMDYDTFRNSAYLAQGHADEFTRKTAGERKEVLRNVLALQRYEEYATRAKEFRQSAAQRITLVDQDLTQTLEELKRLPEVEEQLKAVTAEMQAVDRELKAADEHLTGLRIAAADFINRQRAMAEAESQLARAQRALATSEAERERLERELGTAKAALAREPDVVAAYAELLRLREQESEMNSQFAEVARLRQELNAAEQVVSATRARLEASLDSQRVQARELEGRRTNLPALLEASGALDAEAEANAGRREEYETLTARAQEMEVAAATAVAEADRAMASNKELHGKQVQLEGVDSLCPVCRTPLPEEEAARIREEYAQERRALGEVYQQAKARAESAKQEAAEFARQAALVKQTYEREEQDLAARRRKLFAEMDAAQRAESDLSGVMAEVNKLEAALAGEAFEPESRARAAALSASIAGLGYDAAGHETLRARIAGMKAVEQEHAALGPARERALVLQDGIDRQQTQMTGLAVEVTEAEERLKAARIEVEASEDVSDRLQAAEAEVASLRSRQGDLQRRQGALERDMGQLVASKARAEKSADDIRSAKEEEAAYGDLVSAFGKNGVQAMLIDQSIPELERIANEMLMKMTGGGIQVTLSTTAPLKGGGQAETLDIKISDALGTRDYEMYSGGEAFRVDFALRIALSRLLASRSGASLPTLIVDEGFGTQDQEGLDRLAEAIIAVSDEFELVLVITHIDELKERFQRRIEVTKDAARGSTARVV